MRASYKGTHVSGAERIVKEEDIPSTFIELVNRPRGEYNEMVITLERIGKPVILDRSLPISSYNFDSIIRARKFALQCLIDSGIKADIAEKGLRILEKGPSPSGGNMRGAVLLDVESGERLEPDPYRGVRTVRVDWEDRFKTAEYLPRTTLTERSLDAIVIATKNIHCGVLAELCWSDDPDYTTGYVASRVLGYVRIHPMKEKGNPIGGRVYFINGNQIGEITECLERKPVLVRSLHL